MIFTAGCQKGEKRLLKYQEVRKTKVSETEMAKAEDPKAENSVSQEEPVTIKFANYAVLEEGNSAFWEKDQNRF